MMHAIATVLYVVIVTVASGLELGALVKRARLITDKSFEKAPAACCEGEWSHWLIEDRLMIGVTPGAEEGAHLDDASARRALEDAGIDCFACLDETTEFRDPGDTANLHLPIAPRRTPDMEPFLELLDRCLGHYERGGAAIYMHSSGGRCRPGLVAACLAALLRDDVDADSAAVESAALGNGAASILQRRFMESITSSIKTHRRLLSDQAMADAGMPRGYL